MSRNPMQGVLAGYAASMEKAAALPEAAMPSQELVPESKAPKAEVKPEDSSVQECERSSSAKASKKRKKER